MPKINKSYYTKLLKNKHIKRSEINRKKNIEKKRKIIRDLIHEYFSVGASQKETAKFIRQHGVRIPRDISQDLFEYAGIRISLTPKEERKAISYVNRLTVNAIPKEGNILKTNRVARGSYVYVILAKGYRTDDKGRKKGKKIQRTTLMAFDRAVSKQFVYEQFEDALSGEDESNLDGEFIDSPPLEDLLMDFDITSFQVVGLMKGT